jgi:hypothetical protein
MTATEGDGPLDATTATAVLDGTTRSTARRARFREAISTIATRSTADDLIRWMLVPASIALLLGFNLMLFGWIGAAHTHREIEQIPYLISGGLVGLALVIVGALLLASTFWVAVMRKSRDEADERADARLRELEARIAELQAAANAPANGTRRRPSRATSA